VPRDTPPFAPEGRGDWSDPTIPTTGAMPPLHTPPTCRPVFFEFLDRRHQPRQELEAGLDRGAGPVRPEGKDQGFNVLASRKPRWNSRINVHINVAQVVRGEKIIDRTAPPALIFAVCD